MAWTYSDYVTYDYGSARLSQFRLHVQEVSDSIVEEMGDGGSTISSNALQRYLDGLMTSEAAEIRKCKAAAGTRIVFTRGRARAQP